MLATARLTAARAIFILRPVKALRLSVVVSMLVACGGAAPSGVLDPPVDDRAPTDPGTSPTDPPAGGSSGGSSSGTATPPTPSAVRDPNVAGPFSIAELDASAKLGSDTVAVHAAYPETGAGPFPLVVLAHGFQLPPTQYYGYLKRLASFGYVALTVDFPTSFLGNDNPRQAKVLTDAIDWAKAEKTFGPKVDTAAVGMTGHSLGGKLALLAATTDARVKAAFVLDPVDGGGPQGCSAPRCVVVKEKMTGLAIPTGFLGETMDAQGNGQACAPAAENFTTFYAKARTPSVQITASGANHMSFLDDVSQCGFTCSFCNEATAPNAQVTAMARAMMTAFFERHLRGITGYDAWISGAKAEATWVTPGHAAITTK